MSHPRLPQDGKILIHSVGTVATLPQSLASDNIKAEDDSMTRALKAH